MCSCFIIHIPWTFVFAIWLKLNVSYWPSKHHTIISWERGQISECCMVNCLILALFFMWSLLKLRHNEYGCRKAKWKPYLRIAFISLWTVIVNNHLCFMLILFFIRICMWLFHSLMSHVFVYINLFPYSKSLLLILQIEFVHVLIEGKYCKNIFPLAFSFSSFMFPSIFFVSYVL